MIYTNQRRKQLNKALFLKLKNPLEETITDGGLHLFYKQLPPGTEEVMSEDGLKRNIPANVLPWNAVLPIFVEIERDGQKAYMVNYVNRSQQSISMALSAMEKHTVYLIPGLVLEKGVDYGRD